MECDSSSSWADFSFYCAQVYFLAFYIAKYAALFKKYGKKLNQIKETIQKEIESNSLKVVVHLEG